MSSSDSVSFDIIDLEKGRSILETLPSTIVLIVLFFLVVTIGTERVSLDATHELITCRCVHDI